MMKPLLTFVLAFFLSQSFAAEEQVKFESQSQKDLYGELLKELRCPKCQNQNIADSNAVVAKDMRAKTKHLVEQGNNKEQVIDYMVNRYGQFAHYQPPLNVATSLLWLLPALFIGLAVFMLFRRSNSSTAADKQGIKESQGSSSSVELDKALDDLLSQAESSKSLTSEGDK